MKKKGFNLLLFFCLLVASLNQSCTTTKVALLLPNNDAEKTNVDIFMAQAIYNGLVNDKFPLSTAQYILSHPSQFFVGKCPICRPTETAFKQYVQLLKNNVKLSEKKTVVEPALLKSIQSEDKNTYLTAFNQLILKYSDAQKQRLALSESQQKELEGNLIDARKRGMGAKSNSFGAFCPSCDGACGIKQ